LCCPIRFQANCDCRNVTAGNRIVLLPPVENRLLRSDGNLKMQPVGSLFKVVQSRIYHVFTATVKGENNIGCAARIFVLTIEANIDRNPVSVEPKTARPDFLPRLCGDRQRAEKTKDN